MDKNLKWVNEQKIIRTIEALEKNNMNGYLVENEEELIDKIKEIVSEGSMVACGGSISLFETGVRFIKRLFLQMHIFLVVMP